MDSIILIASLLCFASAAVALLIALVKRIRHNKSIPLRRVYLSLLAISVFLFCIYLVFSDPSGASFLAGITFIPAIIILFYISLRRTIKHNTSKKLWAVTAALIVVFAGIYSYSIYAAKSKYEKMTYREIDIQIDPDFEVKDGDTPIEIKTSREGYQSIMVYDLNDLSIALDKSYANADECRQALKNNPNIDNEYRKYFNDFLNRIEAKYPDANLAVLYHNLLTLKVIVLPNHEFMIKSRSSDSYGCYVMPENTIYIPEGTEYIEGEWGFQVLIHEFCHTVRDSWFDIGDKKYRIKFYEDDKTSLINECMNSVFSCSLLNYYERDIAYQVPSNYLRIMLECMDNYDISDYLEHGDTYFLSKLDEFTGYTNYASVIWKLIALQRNDNLKDEIDLPLEKYEPLNKYLCDMYFDKYITEGMTEEEMKAVVDELVDKAYYDAPEGFKTDTEFFYNYLETYLAASQTTEVSE